MAAPPEVEADSPAVKVVEDGEPEQKHPLSNEPASWKHRRRRRRRSSYLRKLACLRSKTDGKGSFDMEVAEVDGQRPEPTHLVITVNGLIGSSQNWRFAAKQFLKKYPRDVIVHCSECNPSMSTFDGVDKMGERLAEEVMSVAKGHSSLRKISFIGHSLGGLVARYAIAKLYGRDPSIELGRGNDQCRREEYGSNCPEDKFKNKIAGLEPVNFITSATPHLGSRGHKQVPVFCGFQTLEKLATRASWFLGRTGKHLFLTDHDVSKRPLLLQMTMDTDDLKFVSALQSFKRRVAYANASFDRIPSYLYA